MAFFFFASVADRASAFTQYCGIMFRCFSGGKGDFVFGVGIPIACMPV